MTGSSGTSQTSAKPHPFATSFMSSTSSFATLLNSDYHPAAAAGLGDRIAARTGSGVPKFKSLPPPSLPISPASPSSWFAFPPGLSAADLLDSPILLSGSHILPSPTTGTFPIQGFNWNNNSDKDVKIEQNSFSDFSFQTQKEDQRYQESAKQNNITSSDKSNMKSDDTNQTQSLSPEISAIQTNDQSVKDNKKSDDGYNWRKYGQKQVKGSENPRSYYKCTHPNCSTKKKVERSFDGQITEIVYKGNHNHPKPQSTRRSSSSSSASASSAVLNQPYNNNTQLSDTPEQSYGSNVATPENSSVSVGDDEFEQSSQKRVFVGDEVDDEEPHLKKLKGEGESEGVSAIGNRAVREPRVVVQTTSDIDILDDGYRWRKYGQKVVKGNPNPRSYYKCTTQGCPVRKHVERASHDLRSVITTYEGKHNHDVPAPRGSGAQSVSRTTPTPTNNRAMAIRPMALHSTSNYPIPTSNLRPGPAMMEPQPPYGLGMQQSNASFEYLGYGNPHYENSSFSRAKDEPREDSFLESLLC